MKGEAVIIIRSINKKKGKKHTDNKKKETKEKREEEEERKDGKTREEKGGRRRCQIGRSSRGDGRPTETAGEKYPRFGYEDNKDISRESPCKSVDYIEI